MLSIAGTFVCWDQLYLKCLPQHPLKTVPLKAVDGSGERRKLPGGVTQSPRGRSHGGHKASCQLHRAHTHAISPPLRGKGEEMQVMRGDGDCRGCRGSCVVR